MSDMIWGITGGLCEDVDDIDLLLELFDDDEIDELLNGTYGD